MNSDERYSRQKDLVPMDRMQECLATVIGVGAIGRQVSLQLAAMGIRRMQLIDHDRVEESNLASQGYHEVNLGAYKVDATMDACLNLNRTLQVHAIPGRFRRSEKVGDALFCCVDRIGTRRLIWDAVKGCISFFCDGRMSAEALRIITAFDPESRRHYPETLFGQDEAYAGSCTAKTTIYSANVAAGLMVAQFAKWLRRVPVDHDVSLNLLSCEMMTVTVLPPEQP